MFSWWADDDWRQGQAFPASYQICQHQLTRWSFLIGMRANAAKFPEGWSFYSYQLGANRSWLLGFPACYDQHRRLRAEILVEFLLMAWREVCLHARWNMGACVCLTGPQETVWFDFAWKPAYLLAHVVDARFPYVISASAHSAEMLEDVSGWQWVLSQLELHPYIKEGVWLDSIGCSKHGRPIEYLYGPEPRVLHLEEELRFLIINSKVIQLDPSLRFPRLEDGIRPYQRRASLLVDEEYPFEVEWEHALGDLEVHKLYRITCAFVLLCASRTLKPAKRCMLVTGKLVWCGTLDIPTQELFVTKGELVTDPPVLN